MLTKAQKPIHKASWLKLPVLLLMIVFCLGFILNAEESNQDKISQSDKLNIRGSNSGINSNLSLQDSPFPKSKKPDTLDKAWDSANPMVRDRIHKTFTRPGRKMSTDVKRGERPYIDLDSVPEDAYEPGKMFIKLTPEMRSRALPNIINADKSGYAITGIPDLDSLNSHFSVIKYENGFYRLYEISPESALYRESHEAWGFDLWWELTLDKDTDIIEAVKNFQLLSSVDIAEPVYKKRLIQPEKVHEAQLSDPGKFTPNDPYYELNQWHLDNTGQVGGTPGCDIHAEEAWDIEKGYSDVIVSVHDGGILYNHEDIEGNMWPSIGPDGTGTTADDHGTHVGSTISAVMNNSVGVASVAGGSGSDDGVRLMTIDIYTGSLNTYNGYVYAATNGACISNNSWGYENPGVYNQPDLDGIDYFNLNGGGTQLDGGLTIFAAGNDNSNANWYPGYYSGAMAVASTGPSDTKSSFSNYGTWVEISAPGDNIASIATTGYVFMSGTSCSCPVVSGVAALVVSYTSRNGYLLTAEELRTILKDSADNIDSLNPSYAGELGTGRVNAHTALIEAQAYLGELPPYRMTLVNLTGDAYVDCGDSFYYQLRLRNMGELSDRFTLSLTSEWAVGLYADTSDTPLPDPLVLDSLEQYFVYLKVTVPTGLSYWTYADEFVEAYGTGTYDSVSVRTTVPNEMLLGETFETCPATGWTVYELGNAGTEWYCHTLDTIPCMAQPAPTSQGVNYDNWLVSPQITVPTGKIPYLWFYSRLTSYINTGSIKEVYISDGSGNPSSGDFDLILTIPDTDPSDAWAYYEQVLGTYAGQDIYIGFRYRGARRQPGWYITLVVVETIEKRSLPYEEPFTPGIPLYDWTVDEDPDYPVWWISGTGHAGGEPDELMAQWVAVDASNGWVGTTRIESPPIDVSGVSQVRYSFRHRYNDYDAGITLKAQYRTNMMAAGTYNDVYTITSGSGSEPADRMYFNISGLALADTLYLSFSTDGDHYQFNEWYIDDIVVETPVNYEYTFTNLDGNLMMEEGNTHYYQLRVRNIGSSSDNYTFYTSLSSWGQGLYLDDDGTDTPVPVPLTIAGNSYTDVFLKVTVPTGAIAGQTEEEWVTATGTPGDQTIILSTTAIVFIFEEWFETCPPPGWTEYRLNDTAGNHWTCNASGYMIHQWTNAGQYADNWYVSPQITMPAGKGSIYLYFYEAWTAPSYYDYHGIWISTGDGDPNNGQFIEFAEIPGGAYGEEGYFHALSVDFAEFVGESIYIAFRYMGEDADLWAFTGVMIFDEGYEGPDPYYTINIRARHVEGDVITPLEGMNVWLWEQGNPSEILLDADTNSSGLVTVDLKAGTYDFDIYDYYGGYDYYTGTLTVVDAGFTQNCNMTLTNHTVTWEILEPSNFPIEGATIDITGATNPPATNASGITTTTLTKGTYPYTVDAGACYEGISSSVDIAVAKSPVPRGQERPKNTYYLLHNLSDAGCKVTFTVTDGSQGIMGAKIEIEGSPDPLYTDASGYAEADLTCGDYEYIIEAGNYNPYSGTFLVDGSKASIHVELSYDPDYIQPAMSLGHQDYMGIWLWSYDEARPCNIDAKGSSWTNILQGATADKIMAGDLSGNGQLEIIALLSGLGLWHYDINANTWSMLVPAGYTILDFTLARASYGSPGQLIISLKEYGIYAWDYSMGNSWPSAWQSIVNAPALILLADNIDRDINGSDELAIAFADYSGLYVYSFETHSFSRVTMASPSQITRADITNDGYNELVVVFDGLGVYLARFEASGAKAVSYPLFDLAGDIKAGNEWVSKQSSNMGLQFTRITSGTPDEGHYIGTGDIILGFGSEVIMTYLGSTYYYSYDGMKWSVLAYAPFKRIISSTFTGYVRNDLIVCDSSSGSIYLYKSNTHSWELLVAGGNSEAMTALE